jgi:two-component system sensor histidine kinase RpfC
LLGHSGECRPRALSELSIPACGIVPLDDRRDVVDHRRVLYPWVIVGNGMRYGPRYLYAAIGTGVVGFGVALVS